MDAPKLNKVTDPGHRSSNNKKVGVNVTVGLNNIEVNANLDEENKPNHSHRSYRYRVNKSNEDDDKKSLSDGLQKLSSGYSLLIILVYVLCGTTVTHLWMDGWTFIDSMYFTVVSFTTVGYGDLYPNTDGQRAFTTVYVIIGIIVLGGIALGVVFDGLFGAYDTAVKNMRQSVISDKVPCCKLTCGDEKQQWLSDDVKLALFAALPGTALNIAIAAIIGHFEGWTFLNSVYFSFVTSTSIGYGDMSPTTQAMRLVAVIYVPLSVGGTAFIFAKVSAIYIDRKATKAKEEFVSRGISRKEFDKIDKDKSGGLTFDEYAIFMLQAMELLDPKEVELLRNEFDSHDKNGNGIVELQELFDC